MSKSPRDRRRDGEPEPVAPELLVDRVFARPRRATGAKKSPTAAPETAPRTTTSPEIALRHQVLRLQRELGEAQRKLADHDDEIAAERARCQTVTTAHHALVEENAALERGAESERAARRAAERALAELQERVAALAPVENKLAEMTIQFARLGTENGLLGQRLSTAVKTVEVLAQEARVLRERACAAPAPSPQPTKQRDLDDELGEEELKILYGDG